VFSELNPYRDTGCLSIYAGTSVESARKVVESITKEFRDLKEQQVSDEELRRAKDHLKGSLMLGLESTGSRMSNLARQEMYFGKFFTLDELLGEHRSGDGGRRAADRAGVFRPEADRADDFGQSGKVQDRPGGPGVLKSREHPICSIISITCARLKQAPEGGDSRHPPQSPSGEPQESWYLVLDGTKHMQDKGIFP
jgi:Peptidase M16 inactive domain